MYVRGDIALVGWLYMVGVFVFCVVTVVATLSNFLNAFNLRKLTTYAGWGTKGNHRIFREARQWRVYRHDHLKQVTLPCTSGDAWRYHVSQGPCPFRRVLNGSLCWGQPHGATLKLWQADLLLGLFIFCDPARLCAGGG
jgi:hypothetical protein